MAKFRVRARTIDLLGRQQIAGIPTAISELFKNAHDAYARNAVVDLYRDDGLFVLRDDGLGMTREDFETRWLTLGTESKVDNAKSLKPLPKDPEQPLRPVLGEKGIGRLAIAVIGPQVLILSRAKIDGHPSDKVVACYIHWGLFELPGIDLDRIYIPVAEFPAANLPNADDIRKLVVQARSSLAQLENSEFPLEVSRIKSEMETFDVDPFEIDTYISDVRLSGNGTGTHFYIKPADAMLWDDIDGRDQDDKATRFEKNLLGFTNTMRAYGLASDQEETEQANGPDVKQLNRPNFITRISDHRDEGDPVELAGPKTFFTPEEFKMADHHIEGSFDEYGQFRGEISIYQMKPEKCVLSWAFGDGAETLCGPFSLSLAVVQGNPRDTLIGATEYAKVTSKMNRHGGLYIYRDGVRIQPYGGPDYDFLDIERNRTKSASYYFYSFRRLFGYIELTRRENSNLI